MDNDGQGYILATRAAEGGAVNWDSAPQGPCWLLAVASFGRTPQGVHGRSGGETT